MSEIKRCWNEDHRYMLTPSFLLNLIVKHTGMVHSMLSILPFTANLGIGRSIPALRETEKTAEDYELYEQCHCTESALRRKAVKISQTGPLKHFGISTIM